MPEELIGFIVFAMDEQTASILALLEEEQMLSTCKMDPYGTLSLLFPASLVEYDGEPSAMQASFVCQSFQFDFEGGRLHGWAYR